MYDKLTKKDIEKMQKEIEHRKCVIRKEALVDVKEARAHGDLSENFEYKAAKKFKNENESRIKYLIKMIKTASIIEDDSKIDEIGLNDIVGILIIDEDEVEEYKIVTTIRTNSLSNLISIESPLGKSLLGHKIGDKIKIIVSDNYNYDIIIKYIKKNDEENENIKNF
jgi:transcription elongation factor GreA